MKNWQKSVATLFAVFALIYVASAAEIPNTSVFSQTDASNNTGTVPTWAEGMAPSQVNDSARALQGAVTREWNWAHPTLTSGGSANTQTLTYSVAPAAYYNGMRFCFEAGFTTTAASTLNVNTINAVAIKTLSAGTLADTVSGSITAGDRPCVTYRSTGPSFVLENPGAFAQLATANTFTASQTIRHADVSIDTYSADAVSKNLIFDKSRNATPGSHTIVQSGDVLGQITAKGSNGTSFDPAAAVVFKSGGTPGASTDMPGSVVIQTTPDGSATLTDRVTVDATGLVTLSGGQIAFPASQNASAGANTFDDYEENVFTPAFSASGATFNYAANGQVGYYVKVGQLVYFTIRLQLATSGNTLTANALSITGLPFASNSATNYENVYPVSWFSSTTSYIQLSAILSANGTSLAVRGMTAAATDSVTTVNSSAGLTAAGGSVMWLNGSYRAGS